MIRLLLAFPIGIMAFAFTSGVIAYESYDDDNYYESDYDDSRYRSQHSVAKKKVRSATYRTPSNSYIAGKKVFVFDPRHHTWAAYANGKRVKWGRASGGKSYCPDVGRGCKTIVGTFRVISKGGPGCKSSRFPVETGGGAPMPYCMHFHGKGYAVHGSPDVPNYNASHGCVRVPPVDAQWLSHNFMQIGTTVIVRPY